nr:hypothetical protein [Kibdelosporangium sp. MJ126-NF4]CTQ95387.1 hypothetical protein [Kibdelosporangium sp. MJ126-NF4]
MIGDIWWSSCRFMCGVGAGFSLWDNKKHEGRGSVSGSAAFVSRRGFLT